MAQNHTTALFDFSVDRQDSTVAAKNFLTLYNPATSGRVMTVGAFFVSYMTTVASPAYPMRGYRFSGAPTGGTVHAESEFCRFDTARFTSNAEIRTGNPTVTPLAAIFNVPPGIVKDTKSDIQQIDAPGTFNPFLLYPGEGVTVRQEVGAPGHLWNLSILWREVQR